MREERAPDGKYGLTPFLPAWIDDLALSTAQFRVLLHLWRRAGRSRLCYPGAESIARKCRISKDTVWSALKVLEQRGLIRRFKARSRNSNCYELFATPPRVASAPHAVSSDSIDLETPPAETTGCQSAEMEGCQKAEIKRCQKAESTGREGTPTKAERSEGARVKGMDSLAELKFSNADCTRIARVLKLSESGVMAALDAFVSYKRHYPSDPRDVEAVIHHFQHFSAGKTWMSEFRQTAKPHAERRGLPEPPRWRESVNELWPGCVYATGGAQESRRWEEIDSVVQKRIISGMREAGVLALTVGEPEEEGLAVIQTPHGQFGSR